MAKKSVLVLLFFVLFVGFSSGATYYISPTGDDAIGDGTTGNPWQTISYGIGQMSGGDTLIVRNGTYTGNNNNIIGVPSGTAEAYTKVYAENDWGVTLNEVTAHEDDHPIEVYGDYIEIRGFKLTGNGVTTSCMLYGNYIKIIRCASDGVTHGSGAAFNANGNYQLFEECYAWGGSRYTFRTAHSSAQYVIFRRCVGRWDYSHVDEPTAVFANYECPNVYFQNCIAIDAKDIREDWDYEYDGLMSFLTPNGADETHMIGCIALNNEAAGYYFDDSPVTDNTLTNCVAWDCKDGGQKDAGEGYNSWLFYSRPYETGDVTVDKCTFGVSDLGEGLRFRSNGDMTRTLTNSIVYGVTLDDGNYAVSEIEVEDYNCYYGNTGNRDYSGTGGNNDICAANANAINPLLADLLYLTRIESGGTLKTAGTDGGQIGAEIIKKIGVSGTLYGEPGWNETTNVDLWPFPNENEMKEDMGSFYKSAGQIYTGSPEMDGARGFAASGTGIYDGPITLTSYIWEYLGNECPPEICNYNVTEIICIDSDGDGYNQSQSGCGTADCNDTNSSIYPGAIEICGNGIDEDCDGSDLNCTEDITSPIISDITATPSTTSATINWITDEAATSIVEYGLTTSYGDNVAVLSLVLSHLVSLTGLQSSTTYHYRVLSDDSAGNEAVSGDGVFTTTVETGGDDGEDSGGSSGGGSSGGGSSSAECVLTNAYWSVVSAREGEEVLLTVEGEDCEGEGIDLFVIWEADLIGDDSVNNNPASINFLDGQAVSTWTVEYQDDFFGNPEYYFVSSLKSDSIVKIDSRDYGDLLRVVEAGSQVISGCPDYVWTGIR